MKIKRKVFEKILFFPANKVDSLKQKQKRLDFLIFFFDVFVRILLISMYVYYKEIIESLDITKDLMLALIYLLLPIILYLVYKHIKYINLMKTVANNYLIELIEEEEGLI